MGRHKTGKKRKKNEDTDKDDLDGQLPESTSSESEEEGEENSFVPYYVTDYTRLYQEDSISSEMNMISSPSCTFCNSNIVQSLDHIFFECSHFSTQRTLLFENLKKIYKSDDNIPHSVPVIMKNLDTYPLLFKYIEYTIEEI
ncbi:hypothetical protein ACJJTC_005104 [Scirpophaga incertulas]